MERDERRARRGAHCGRADDYGLYAQSQRLAVWRNCRHLSAACVKCGLQRRANPSFWKTPARARSSSFNVCEVLFRPPPRRPWLTFLVAAGNGRIKSRGSGSSLSQRRACSRAYRISAIPAFGLCCGMRAADGARLVLVIEYASAWRAAGSRLPRASLLAARLHSYTAHGQIGDTLTAHGAANTIGAKYQSLHRSAECQSAGSPAISAQPRMLRRKQHRRQRRRGPDELRLVQSLLLRSSQQM